MGSRKFFPVRCRDRLVTLTPQDVLRALRGAQSEKTFEKPSNVVSQEFLGHDTRSLSGNRALEGKIRTLRYKISPGRLISLCRRATLRLGYGFWSVQFEYSDSLLGRGRSAPRPSGGIVLFSHVPVGGDQVRAGHSEERREGVRARSRGVRERNCLFRRYGFAERHRPE